MATAGRLIRLRPRFNPGGDSLYRAKLGKSARDCAWRVRQPLCDAEHVTRVEFGVSTLTLSSPDLKLFLKVYLEVGASKPLKKLSDQVNIPRSGFSR